MRLLILGPLALLLVALLFADCTVPPAAPTTIPSPAGDPGGAPTKPMPTPTIEIPPPIY
jgi:hypothetical protein